MRKKLFIGLTVFFMFMLSSNCFAYIDTSVKVYDYANLFTDEEAALMQNEIESIMAQYPFDIVILTEDSYVSSPYDYGVNFYDSNNFGIGEHGDGIMLYINMANRKVNIITTGRCRPVYDRKVEKMLDEVTPLLTSGNYSGSANRFISLTKSYIDKAGGLPSGLKDPIYVFQMCIIISVIATSVIIIIILIMHKKSIPKAQSHHRYLAGNILERIIRDDFVSTHTSRVKIESSSGSSGGGGSSSGGGRSHGGGGRSF